MRIPDKRTAKMDEFIVEKENGEGLICYFEDEGETGYFYPYEPDGRGIVDFLHLYSTPHDFELSDADIDVVWSRDKTKCGVRFWGKLYGIFDIASGRKLGVTVKSQETPPIDDSQFLDRLEW